MAAELFISYARKDWEQVQPWVQQLQAAGLSTWMDVSGIDGALLWGQEIVAAIESCQVLILMVTASSVASEHVLREVSLGIEARKPIFPLLLEPVAIPQALRYPLAGIQHLELFGGDGTGKLQAVLRSLARLGITGTEPASPGGQAALGSPPGRNDLGAFSASLRPPAGGARHNLPIQLTSFVGREREITEVTHRFATTRLLTLSGPGGVGKTRLALRVAADLIDDFADGVLFVPLAPIADPALVMATIGQTLGVRETKGRTLAENLKEYLREKQLLLVLDNFEHVLTAAPLVVDLLTAAPRLKVLVTSRAVLRLRGEKEYLVPPMALPDAKHLPAAEDMHQYGAIALFVQRALDVKPDFVITEESARSVTQICDRLDGLPLAIELAATRIKLLPSQVLLSRLDSRLRLLTGGARDLPVRQQTMRAAIAWSYDLLEEGEQRLFRRLSVFAGAFTLEAAEAVCNAAGDLGVDALDGVASLADKSLLRQETRVSDQPGWGMLETIREYAREQLGTSGEAELIRSQHAQFFLAFAERVDEEEASWLDRLEREDDNLRAALQWYVESGRSEEGVALGRAMFHLWHLRSYWSEGRERLAELLALPGIPPKMRALLLKQMGQLAWLQNDQTTARSLLGDSLAIYRELGDSEDLPATINALGEVARTQGDYETARALFEESLALVRAEGDKSSLAWTLQALGEVFQDQGDAVAAQRLIEESLALFQETGDQPGRSVALRYLGEVARHREDLDKARALHEASLAIRRQLGRKGGIAVSLMDLGIVAIDQGNDETAQVLLEESLAIQRELHDRRGMRFVAKCLEGLAAVAVARRRPEQAVHLMAAAAALREDIGSPLPPGERADCERSLAAARTILSEEAFAAAWAKGREMPLQQVLELALGGKAAMRSPAGP